VNPVTGRRELILVSREQEQAAGREGAEQVAAAMGIFSEARLTAYVAAVGARVAAHSPREQIEWRFEIVDQEVPNAFALPDGHIYVSRGLLELSNSEDELAGVLAHEVAHVAARHHAQQQTRATGVGLLALPGVLAGAVLGGPVGQVVQAPLLVLGAGVVASYGRDQEREADRVGQRLAAMAGYDPVALSDYLTTLARWSEGREGRLREPGFLDTHPSTPERVATSRKSAAALGRQPIAGIAADREAFLRRLEDLVVGENPSEGVFQGARFLQPDSMLSLHFPEGWQTRNARSQVAAFSPDERASVVLEIQGRGSDPNGAAKATLAAISRDAPLELLRADALSIAGSDAFRVEAVVEGRRGAAFVHLTWIAYGGLIYRVAGVVDGAHARTHRAALEAASDSFRPLRADERRSIRERRLRLARARANEGLAALSRRSGSVWEPGYVALANGLAPDAVPEAGRLVKIALEEPYAGRAPEGEPAPGG
jgi:predicted Zn-dependent protease